MTDVEDLHKWMVSHFEQFPLFQRVLEDDYVSKIKKKENEMKIS